MCSFHEENCTPNNRQRKRLPVRRRLCSLCGTKSWLSSAWQARRSSTLRCLIRSQDSSSQHTPTDTHLIAVTMRWQYACVCVCGCLSPTRALQLSASASCSRSVLAWAAGRRSRQEGWWRRSRCRRLLGRRCHRATRAASRHLDKRTIPTNLLCSFCFLPSLFVPLPLRMVGPQQEVIGKDRSMGSFALPILPGTTYLWSSAVRASEACPRLLVACFQKLRHE